MKRTLSEEEKQKRSQSHRMLWQNPVWRAQMIEKQKRAGLRNYGMKLSGKVVTN